MIRRSMHYSHDTMFPVILLTILTLSAAQDLNVNQPLPERKPVKRHYVCPPNFVRLSHRCYFFSKEKTTFQDAFFKCQDMHSNLAIIKNKNQDKIVRKTLSKDTLAPLERWIGGQYDWKQMQWKWAASGKPVTFQNFANVPKGNLKWHCMIVDPRLQYRWNARSCLEEKQFICQTRIKTVTNKGKKKLQRQFNVSKYNKLNEIPVPDLPNIIYKNNTNFKQHTPISFSLEFNRDLMGAQYATRESPKKKHKNRKNKKHRMQILKNSNNSTMATGADQKMIKYNEPVVQSYNFYRRRRNRVNGEQSTNSKAKEMPIKNIKWRTYKKEANGAHPLYPNPIVEEYYVKEVK